jgi:hypothetical protein
MPTWVLARTNNGKISQAGGSRLNSSNEAPRVGVDPTLTAGAGAGADEPSPKHDSADRLAERAAEGALFALWAPPAP